MTRTIPNVPRELKPVLAMILNALDRDAVDGKQARAEMAAELRALLSATSPAGVYSAINVPCDLLETLIEQHITAHGFTNHTARQAQLILCAPSPAGVDGLDVVEYQERSIYGNWDRIYKLAYDKRLAAGCPEQFRTLSVTADAQAIIDGLRGEVAELKQSAQGKLILRLYQHAKRIGELEGLLREVHDTYRAAIHWEDLRGTMKRIDAALSAGKDSD